MKNTCLSTSGKYGIYYLILYQQRSAAAAFTTKGFGGLQHSNMQFTEVFK